MTVCSFFSREYWSFCLIVFVRFCVFSSCPAFFVARQWLQKNRTEGCSAAALAMAAGSGHLSTVEWFYGNGIQGDIAKAIDAAAEGGHGKVNVSASRWSYWVNAFTAVAVTAVYSWGEMLENSVGRAFGALEGFSS